MTRLSVAAVRNLKPGKKRREVLDITPGLYLVIQPSGHKSWALRYKRDGKRFKLTLGSCDLSGKELVGEPAIGGHLTLTAARRLASEVHRQRAMGRDPVAERKAEKIAASVKVSPAGFAAAVKEYVEKHCRDLKGFRGWDRTAKTLGLRYFPRGNCREPSLIKGSLCHRWADRPIGEITEDECFKVIEDAHTEGIPGRGVRTNGQSSARQRDIFNALGGLFRWLRQKRKITVNPMAGLERPEPSGEGDRVLADDELKRIWMACDDGPFGRIVKLLILTGQRTGEVSGMRWSELGEDTWIIPAERAKNGREHVVPLAPAMRELIKPGDFGSHYLVFTTNGRTPFSGFSKAKGRLDEVLNFEEPWQLRDIRRTVATGMAEIGVQPHITEAVLNHVSGHKGGVAGIYNKASYAEPKRNALERWAAHVDEIISKRASENMAEFARVRA
jgi:integrase